MTKFKRFLRKSTTLLAFLAFFSMASKGQAAEYSTDNGGYGYEEVSRTPSIAPAVALGTIALVAIIAVALQNQSHGHGHSH